MHIHACIHGSHIPVEPKIPLSLIEEQQKEAVSVLFLNMHALKHAPNQNSLTYAPKSFCEIQLKGIRHSDLI